MARVATGARASLRPREPLRQRRLPTCAREPRHRREHESSGRRLGYCSRRELLRDDQDRTDEHTVYATRDAAITSIAEYVERFYNPRRRYSHLGHISRIEFELKAQVLALAA